MIWIDFAEFFIFALLAWVYSRELTHVTILGFSLASFALERGRGLSLWLYSMETVVISFIHHEELTTSSASYLLRMSPKCLKIERPRVWVHNINIYIYIYIYYLLMTSHVGSQSSLTFTSMSERKHRVRTLTLLLRSTRAEKFATLEAPGIQTVNGF